VTEGTLEAEIQIKEDLPEAALFIMSLIQREGITMMDQAIQWYQEKTKEEWDKWIAKHREEYNQLMVPTDLNINEGQCKAHYMLCYYTGKKEWERMDMHPWRSFHT
jgi:hypothetical protein